MVELGRVGATPGVMEALPVPVMLEHLRRHESGDWGEVDDHDRRANDRAVRDGRRILSQYTFRYTSDVGGHHSVTFWIITEADRSVTTIMLPEDY